jgi:hypothetical protein
MTWLRNTRLMLGFLFTLSALDKPAMAQLPSAGDRDASGRIYTKIVTTITGEAGAFGHPVSNLRFLVVTENGDRVSVQTNDAGVGTAWLSPGSYRIVNPDAYPWNGNAYTWDIIVPVKPGAGIIRLTQANATRVIALAPVPSAPSAPRVVTVPSSPGKPTLASDAVQSVTQGFFVAPHLLGASLKAEDEPTESGGGGGVSLGYGFSRNVAAFFTADVASIDINDSEIEGTYTLANVDFGLRFNLTDQSHKGVPYLEAAFTGRAAQTTVEGIEIQISGPAFSGGVGLNYYFQQKLAFDLGLSYTYGKFDTLEIDGDETPFDSFNATGARFRIGVTWFPFTSIR